MLHSKNGKSLSFYHIDFNRLNTYSSINLNQSEGLPMKCKFLSEFRDFAMKGNVVDLAVGVIIGGAFGKIVSSLVADIIMPPLGVLIGGIDFKSLAIVLRDAHDGLPATTLNYGLFIQNIFDFLIVAFTIFLAIKGMNKLRNNQEAEQAVVPPAPPAPSQEEILLTEIRDLLKAQNGSNK